MIWLVQNALFGEEAGYDQFTAAIDFTGDRRIQLDYTFWDFTIDLKLTGADPAEVVPFGTRELVAFGMKNGWNVSWDRSFEYSSLLELGEDFINHDMQVASLSDLKVPDSGKVFIREAAGFNIIKGKVISGYAWPEWLNGFTTGRTDNVSVRHHDWHPIDGSTLFVCAPVKVITDEYRVWIVDGKVVSSSQYIINGQIEYRNTDDLYEVNGYAQRIADRLRYDMQSYVLDIFRTDHGLKVGEINCLHCSGWYSIDSCKVVEAIKNSTTFNQKREK